MATTDDGLRGYSGTLTKRIKKMMNWLAMICDKSTLQTEIPTNVIEKPPPYQH